jgi:hypothetical protein
MTGTLDFGFHVIKQFLTRYHKNEPTNPYTTRLSFNGCGVFSWMDQWIDQGLCYHLSQS